MTTEEQKRVNEIREEDGDADCYNNIGEALADIRFLLRQLDEITKWRCGIETKENEEKNDP